MVAAVKAVVARWHVAAAVMTAVAASTAMYSWPGQGVAAAAARRHAAAAVMTTTVGLLPRPSVSSHSRGKRLFFSQMMARVFFGGGGGVPSPLIEPKMGREGKGPT